MQRDIQKIKEFKKFFKQYLVKNYGKKCPDRCLGCIACDVWKIYEDFELLINDIKCWEKTEKKTKVNKNKK